MIQHERAVYFDFHTAGDREAGDILAEAARRRFRVLRYQMPRQLPKVRVRRIQDARVEARRGHVLLREVPALVINDRRGAHGVAPDN